MLLVAVLGLAGTAAADAAAASSAAPTAAAGLRDLPALARSILGRGQGVYVEAADGTVLLAQAADTPVHPASVSKVPTTLALLRRFGPEHRFDTTFAADGPVHDGTLAGDLIVEGGGDPYFVDENALLVVERLQALGVRRISGRLRVQGAFTFDWQADADGERLGRAMSGAIPAAAWAAVRALTDAPTPDTPPTIEISNGTLASTAVAGTAQPPEPRQPPSPPQPLVIHRSQPLLALAKSLNDYSNNIFKPLADAAGGAEAVETLARSVVPAAMRSEITLGDGAGTDPRNRLSPRAAVALLRALAQELAARGHGLVDILPVAGVDQGTLHERLNEDGVSGRVVGKTGTYGDYGASALVGAILTSDRGIVYFAILDHGIAVPEARRHQDRLVRELLRRLHTVPWDYRPDARPAVARAEVVDLR
jgi:D-alanyl-D-alanine carboxypeptidase/D-alanyl-D-alanine-endopeptidase (penicillin-binding protein 4)